MIPVIHSIYKTCNTFGIKNVFTNLYENVVLSTMNHIDEADIEECKSVIRYIFFIQTIPYFLLFSFLNKQFRLNYPVPMSIVVLFLLAVYGFVSNKVYKDVLARMKLFIKIATSIFVIGIVFTLVSHFNFAFLFFIYVIVLLCFGAIILLFYSSLITSDFLVIIAKKIVKYSLKKEQKINVLVSLINLIFWTPVLFGFIVKIIER